MMKQLAARKKQFGQSLVETALFLPILVILIAGVVEVSQLTITKNRITNAARVSTRFAANGGEDEGMVIVALNTVTQTLNMDENRWDMWSIRATVNEAGDDFSDWTFQHTYGVSNTVLFTRVNEAAIQQEVLDQLRTDNFAAGNQGTIAANVRIVGSYILHDVDSILGLDAFPALAEFSSVRALNIMRNVGIEIDQTGGCAAFPIGIKAEIRSVTPPGAGSNPYPYIDPDNFANNDFTFPSGQGGDPHPPIYATYTNHHANKPLAEAQEGWIFKVHQDADFAWLRWNGQDTGASLPASLRWPGDSTDYSDEPHHGYSEPRDPTDQSMQIGDVIAPSNETLASSAVTNELKQHILKKRTLRLPLWSAVPEGNYQIDSFAVFRILGYQSTTDPWLLLEFIRIDDSCGQVIP